MVWQIFQHLTSANKINKNLRLAKCYTTETKLYIRTSPSKGKCTKSGPRREPKDQSQSRYSSSDSDSRQACPVKAYSYRKRCPSPTHTGATGTKIATTTQDRSQTVRQKNHRQHGIYMLAEQNTPTTWHNHLWFRRCRVRWRSWTLIHSPLRWTISVW